MSVRTALRHSTRTAQGVLLFAVPHGGQQTARRNAWAGMVAESARGRDRREATVAMDRAATLSARTAAR